MRPIDADKLLEYEIVLNENMGLKMVASQFITAAPTLDVAPVVHGEWIADEYFYYRCSNCGFEQDAPEYVSPYCPQCGAKMDGKEESE